MNAQPIREDSPLYVLWKHMVDEHDLTLVTSELDEIVILASRCRESPHCSTCECGMHLPVAK